MEKDPLTVMLEHIRAEHRKIDAAFADLKQYIVATMQEHLRTEHGTQSEE